MSLLPQSHVIDTITRRWKLLEHPHKPPPLPSSPKSSVAMDDPEDKWGAKGHCSWCFSRMFPTKASRGRYVCSEPSCGRGLVPCRGTTVYPQAPGVEVPCSDYACWDSYGSISHCEVKCAVHMGVIDRFERFAVQVCLSDLDQSPALFGERTTSEADRDDPKASARSVTDLMEGCLGQGCSRQYWAATAAPLGSRASLFVLHRCHSYSTYPFRLVCYRRPAPGDGNLTVITVSGYLSQGERPKDWSAVLASSKYSSAAWYHLDWEAGTHHVQSHNVSRALHYGFRSIGLQVLGLHSRTLKTRDRAVKAAVTVFEHFERHTKIAEMAGFFLADVLARSPLQRRVVLLGHSLGARAVFHCLCHTLRSPKDIEEAQLLGGCVTADPRAWEAVACQTRVVNHFSRDDGVLSVPTLGEGKMAGQGPIPVGSLVNVDHSFAQGSGKALGRRKKAPHNVVCTSHLKWKVPHILEENVLWKEGDCHEGTKPTSYHQALAC
eukprot:RCo022019